MATRIKSIAYSFPMNFSDVPDDAEYTFPSITVTIPEAAAGVTFRSAMLEIGFHDKVTATGGTIDDYHVSMQIDASGYTTIDDEDDYPHGGFSLGGILGPFDFTNLFTANWSTSLTHSVYARFRIDQKTGTTLGMRALTAVLWLTYEYDDAAQHHAKTAIIPLESLTNSLSTIPDSEIGTNQIPRLMGTGGLLPESGVTILDYFFIIEGNQTVNSTASFTVQWKIDSDPTYAMVVVYAIGNGCGYILRYVSRHTGSEPATDSVHAFRMWSSLANRMHAVTITLYVTYQFDASASVMVLNTQILLLASTHSTGYQQADLAMIVDAWIAEPEPITLKQSGIRLNYVGRANFQFWIGLQQIAPRSYSKVISWSPVAQLVLQQRLDSGAAAGVGLNASRGLNRIGTGLHLLAAASEDFTVFGAYVILNYHSAKASQGVGAHAHSVRMWIKDMDYGYSTSYYNLELYDRKAHLPEAVYRLISYGMVAYCWRMPYLIKWNALLLSAETDMPHQVSSLPIVAQYYSKVHPSMPMEYARRWPNDPKVDGFDVTIPRTIRLDIGQYWAAGLFLLYCYHSITFAVGGKVTGYSGDGSGIMVDLFRSDSDECIGRATTIAGGNYTFTWYDDTIPVYAVARQDSQRSGRSDDGLAS